MSSEVDTNEENALIRDLRAQLKEAKAQLKSVDPEVIRAQVLAEANRESTAASLMDKAGYPKLSGLFASQVDGDLSAESAAEFLSGLGLAAEKPSDDPEPEPVAAGGLTPAQIAVEVERLAAAGAEAGSLGKTDVPIDELVANARTSEEITQIMRDANLTVQGY